jgi:hypothetical protein
LDYLPPEAMVIVEDWDELRASVNGLEEQALATREERVRAGQLPADYPLPYVTWDELQDELRPALCSISPRILKGCLPKNPSWAICSLPAYATADR